MYVAVCIRHYCWAVQVDTTMVGTVMNGLSHVAGSKSQGEFVCGLIRGLGGNLDMEQRTAFAREVFAWVGERPPDSNAPLDCYYDGGFKSFPQSKCVARLACCVWTVVVCGWRVCVCGCGCGCGCVGVPGCVCRCVAVPVPSMVAHRRMPVCHGCVSHPPPVPGAGTTLA